MTKHTGAPWKALVIYHYYDGPTVFSAHPENDPYLVYMLRWREGGTDADRLFVADRPVGQTEELYVYESQIDFSEAK